MRITILEILAAAAALVVAIVLFSAPRAPTHAGRTPQRDGFIPAPAEVEAIDSRLRAKNQLARRIATERMPILKAAELFRQANGEDGLAALVYSVPGRSVREKLCRQVIDFVRAAERDFQREGHPLSTPHVSVELQADLDRLLVAGELPPEPGVPE